MSFTEAQEAGCAAQTGSIELLIEPRLTDLGEFAVRRALPAKQRRMVGPFVFFDHMGPAEFPPGKGIAVRPHPHIGIATITYLFTGEIIHRDSLGLVQAIQPGAINLMTAGRGIVHSERAGADLDTVSHLHGIQSWIALPEAQQECAPEFLHYPANDLPRISLPGVSVRVIMGAAYDVVSPVKCHSRTLYLDCELSAGASLVLPDSEQEMALYVVAGEVAIDGNPLATGVMAVACPGKTLALTAAADARIMVVGGDPVGERFIFWNFVSSSSARIEQAKQDWQEGRFPAVPGDDEFIPLPG
jgi:redox-sensitive bicupin YhaK (pirin superfamily)